MIFKYKCQSSRCGREFEYFHVNKQDVAECARCGSKLVEKIFAPKVSVVVNGASAKNNYGLKPDRKKK